jgi:hypothetical protein
MPSKTIKITTAAAVLALGLLASQPATAADTSGNTPDSHRPSPSASSGTSPTAPPRSPSSRPASRTSTRTRDLKFVAHVGDIKNGSSVCSDEYFSYIRTQFDTFTHPLVYTPGDNEWVDCHRTNNGAYNPLERLDKLREVFFNEPGKTLGATMPVKTQENLGLPEDVRFTQNRVAFSVLNIQGSNNSLLPWSGLGKTAATPEQLAEVEHRTDAVLAQIRETFRDAERRNDRAVVLMTQADMFDPSLLAAASADPDTVSGFREIVQAITEETNRFDAPVYLINGDSHVFAENQPLAAGSPWLDIYGQPAADNLQRITVDGANNAVDYVRFTVAGNSADGADVLSWEKVPFSE